MIGRLLVCCRGEIAHRFVRTARRLGVETVIAHVAEDAGAPFVLAADERVVLRSEALADLGVEILETARRVGAQAVAPGYGPFAENADFAAACAEAGLLFVGPAAGAIRLAGDKVAAREAAREAGVPVVPGGFPEPTVEAAAALAGEIGYPVLLKALLGGGGRGIRVAETPAGFPAAYDEVRREARAAFGGDALYLERFLGESVRHVEVQILGDGHGGLIAVGDRACSVQRRRQKVIEEAPAPGLSDTVRARLHAAALALGRAIGYDSAGTVEFLVDPAGDFRFIELNARIQVEHPVTEAVTGVDIVEEMLRAASGEPLSVTQDAVATTGHAIEYRICAEDPFRDFLPTGGRVTGYRVPEGAGIRIDSGVDVGTLQSRRFDSLCAKLIVWGRDRAEALDRSRDALDGFRLSGFATNLPFHRWALDRPAFRAGDYDLSFAGGFDAAALPGAETARDMAVAAALGVALAAPAAGNAAGNAAAQGTQAAAATGPSAWRWRNDRLAAFGGV